MKRKAIKVEPGTPATFMRFTDIVEDMFSCLHHKDKQYLLAMKEDDLASLHHTLGQHIRNFYRLWDPENPYTMKDYKPMYVSAEQYGKMIGEKFVGDIQVDANPNHPDQFSQRVILALHRKLREEPEKELA